MGQTDMSLFIFVQKILQKKKLPVFNHGNHVRDFTYIDDVVNGIVNAIHYKDKKIYSEFLILEMENQ